MRLPFPERFSLVAALFFAIVICGVEQLQGTNIVFSICAFLFIIVATLAFNLAGGFIRPTGSYIFFYSFGVIAGLSGKAVLGEAADTHLLVPNLTMEVFLGGISAMLASVFLARKLTRKKPFLQNVVKTKDMQNATIGSMVTGFTILISLQYLPRENGSVITALSQLNKFLDLSIILGTIHQIYKTQGRSSFNPLVFFTIVMSSLWGVVLFSKEGMFGPIFCWLIAAASMRYKVSWSQIIAGVVFGYVLIHFLVPFAQVGRTAPSTSDRVGRAFSLLTKIGEIQQTYTKQLEEQYSADMGGGYYNHPEGLLDRLEILSPDDALINATERGKPFGLEPIQLEFLNLIPHVFYPTKPTVAFGNLYAHEIGGLIGEEDFTTGISFSPSGDGYHMAKWVGVLLVAPIIWTMLFTNFDSLCGDVRQSPWGLLMIVVYAHSAPEGMLGAPIYMMGFTTITLVVAAYTSAHIMPLIGTLLFGPEKTHGDRRSFSSFAMRQGLPIASSSRDA